MDKYLEEAYFLLTAVKLLFSYDYNKKHKSLAQFLTSFSEYFVLLTIT